VTFVSVNVTVGTPPAVAAIVKPPSVPFAVKVGLLTTPPLPIVQTATTPPVTVHPVVVPVNVALAPLLGVIVKVISPPATGSPLVPVTVRPTPLAKAVFRFACCEPPVNVPVVKARASYAPASHSVPCGLLTPRASVVSVAGAGEQVNGRGTGQQGKRLHRAAVAGERAEHGGEG